MILATQEHPLEDYTGKSAIFNPCSSEVIKWCQITRTVSKKLIVVMAVHRCCITGMHISASCRKESATQPDLLYCTVLFW